MKKLISPSSSLWNYYFDFLNSSNGLKNFFNTLIIETTTYCNRACAYCPNSKFDRGVKAKEEKLDEKLFTKVVDELSSLNFSGKILPHLYGEPFLDERLPELLGYAKSRLPGSLIVTHTNGDYLNKQLLEKMEKSNLDAIIVTEHGAKPNPRVQNLVDTYRGSINLIYRPSSELNFMNRGGLVEVEDQVRFEKCFYPTQALSVNAQGKVVLCCNDYHGDQILGDLNIESIVEIWNKKDFRTLRQQISKGDFRLDICKKCTN